MKKFYFTLVAALYLLMSSWCGYVAAQTTEETETEVAELVEAEDVVPADTIIMKADLEAAPVENKLPVPIKVFFIVWGALCFISIGFLHYDYKYELFKPDPRWNVKAVWWGTTIADFVAPIGLIFHIIARYVWHAKYNYEE